jgi:hypothetical protein
MAQDYIALFEDLIEKDEDDISEAA